jgi:hypothetical protein
MPIRSFRSGSASTPSARIEALERDVRRLRAEVGAARRETSSAAGAGAMISWATLGLAVLGVLLALLALARH